MSTGLWAAFYFACGAWAGGIIGGVLALYIDSKSKPAHKPASGDWLDMATAPTDGTPVMLYGGAVVGGHAYSPTIKLGHYTGGRWMLATYACQGPVEVQPKAWMPMPTFPRMTED